MPSYENVLLKETNTEKCSISIIAKFEETCPVKYIIRVTAPNGCKADYGCKLECLKKLGELLGALHSFSETELYIEDTAKLKKVLTSKNLKNFADILKSTKIRDTEKT
ncbi:MAG: hypothetical protein CW691_04660 [Candidatus Bathyarchaeum sp.]|nr:MAG: hypothetical protein CW691_04660 [Candidatus Bathyarchaeum sp.]